MTHVFILYHTTVLIFLALYYPCGLLTWLFRVGLSSKSFKDASNFYLNTLGILQIIQIWTKTYYWHYIKHLTTRDTPLSKSQLLRSLFAFSCKAVSILKDPFFVWTSSILDGHLSSISRTSISWSAWPYHMILVYLLIILLSYIACTI